MQRHTDLWKKLKACDPQKAFGAIAVGKTWCWHESWLNRVREECSKQTALYGFLAPGPTSVASQSAIEKT
jgi:hypothetical protein